MSQHVYKSTTLHLTRLAIYAILFTYTIHYSNEVTQRFLTRNRGNTVLWWTSVCAKRCVGREDLSQANVFLASFISAINFMACSCQ